MNAAHLKKVEARAERVRQLLLPLTVTRGDVGDPQDRLRELIKRIGGRDVIPQDVPLRAAVADVVRFLETDMPEMVQAVRDANAEAQQARRELSMRAGTRYQVTLMSDAPIGVAREVLEPGS
jgi:hypothetical protein